MANDKKNTELKTIVFKKDGTTVLMELKGQPYGKLPIGTVVTVSEGIKAKCSYLSDYEVGFTLL